MTASHLGEKTIHWAIKNDNAPLATLVMQLDPQWSSHDIKGRLPIEIARLYDASKCIDLIQRFGCDGSSTRT